MAGSTAARERVERICAAGADARTLRLRLLAELRRAVGFDAYAWVLTDPETRVGCGPLADVPCLPELPRLIRLRYLTALNRWTTLTDRPVALLAEATDGDLGRSPLWRELLCRYDVADVASVVFRDGFGCWAFLELWRTGGRAFDRVHAQFLRDVAPTVTTALRRGQARTFETASPSDHPTGPLLLLLAPDLQAVRQTPGTRDALRLLVPRDDEGPPVPAGALNVAAQLLAVEAGVDASPPWARVHLAGNCWLTLRAARLEGDAPREERDIAVTIHESSASERLSLFARCTGLSAREAELLAHLATGADTRDVAARMFLSAHTVQDHLKSVFDKTGTRSRRTLLARVLGA
ncbi:LuxR C-terminal-related transcriptional regulator [Geodermatophilus arenarius]|uniref:Helix-turn-helix transcriptional regulator n=1 Tax=Geodermatophilus arenarius TaxID=1137990 RepID=A0ABV9LGV1_9ACTN